MPFRSLACLNVDFGQFKSGGGDVGFAVFVKKQIGINGGHIHPDGLAPWTSWIFCCNVKIAAKSDVGGYHIKSAFMVADGGSKYVDFSLDLLFVMDTVAYLGPIDQIFAVEDGYSRKIFKATVNEVVVVAYSTNAWVGIETRDHCNCRAAMRSLSN